MSKIIFSGGASNKQIYSGTLPVSVYIIYALYITCCTYIDAIGYLLEFELFPWITGMVITLLIIVFFYKKIVFQFRYNKVHKLFWLYASILLLLTFIRSVYPDVSYDTYNYQLLAQDRFMGGFTGGLAPGNFQYYGFALGSRMFYPFRELLGYRLGTMLTGGALCLTMYQLVEILSKLVGRRLKVLREESKSKLGKVFRTFLREEFISFVIIFIPEAFVTLSGYYVEILMFPLILEGCYLLMFEESENNTLKVWFAMIVGLLFAMKMTTIVYVVPMLLLFLWRNRKTISVKLFFLCFIIAIIPILPYVTINWIELKNPIFPYFNSIFKSPFFSIDTDFKDQRWGPMNMKELILWPLYTIFKPEYRQLEIPRRWTGDFFCGFVVWIICLFRNIGNFVNKKYVEWPRFSLCIICGISFWTWAATTGVSRYYMHGFLLFSILAWDYIVNRLYNALGIKNIIAILFSLGFSIQVFVVLDDFNNGREFGFRDIEIESFKEQLPFLFIDKTENETVDIEIDAFLQQDYMSGLAYMSNSTVPIYRCDYFYKYKEVMDPEIATSLGDEIETLLNQSVYTVEPLRLLSAEFFDVLNDRGIYAESITSVSSNIAQEVNSRMLVKLKPLENKTNCLYNTPLDMPELTADILEISAYVFFSEARGWLNDKENFLRITAVNDEQKEVVFFGELNEDSVLHVHFTVDFAKYNKIPKLVWEWVNAEGVIQENWLYKMNILNPTINGKVLTLNIE